MSETSNPYASLYSADVERAILGAVLIDPAVMGRLVHQVDEDDFYLETNRKIWHLFAEMHGAGRAIDVVSVSDEAEAKGLSPSPLAVTWATDLLQTKASPYHAEWHAIRAREYRVKREVINACQDGVKAAYGDGTVDAALSQLKRATTRAEKLLNGNVNSLSHRQSLDLYLDVIERRDKERDNKRLFFPWSGMSNLMPFLEGGDLVGILAEPGAGKTAFLECCAEAWAQLGWRVLFFHLELSTQRMLDRRMQRMTGVPIRRLQDGGQTDGQDYTLIAKATSDMSQWTGDIEYIHAPGWSMAQIVGHTQRQMDRHGVDVVICDYLNKVRMVERGNMNSAQCRGADIEDFKVCLEELAIVGLMAGQFDKAAKRMKNRSLADARDTGELEDKANVGIVIDRPRDSRGARPEATKVNVVKCNAGVEGQVQMRFDGARLQFVETAEVPEFREPINLWGED